MDSVTDSVASMAVSNSKVKSQNLNVIEEYLKSNPKPSANFVVVGA